jgi:predicted dehydrogenase/nucleoside-diphosphate-sugar epimerase
MATVIESPTSSATKEAAPVRLVLIGCGAISEQMHLPILAGHEKIKLAALVDRDGARAGRLAEGYGVAQVLNDARQLDEAHVDAAIVATPPFHHAPCSIDLLRRGIHVLVEKPMALNLAEAEAMVEAAETADRVLAVGFFRRLLPSIRLTKSLLTSHWLGRPRRFEVEGGGMYNWAAATLANMRKDWAGGGVLIDFGSHMLDLLLYLFDDPTELIEYRDNSLGGIEADCSLRLRAQHGGQAVEGSVLLARTRNLGCGIRIECERGTIEFTVNERFRVKVWPSDINLVDPHRGDERGYWLDAGWSGENEELPWYDTFRAEIDDFVTAIANGTQPQLSGRSALRTVRLIDECYRRREAMDEPWVTGGIVQGSAEVKAEGRRQKAESETQDLRPKTSSANPKSTRRVLITGATGFIGARIAEVLHLEHGWDVRALVHNPGNASRLARLPIELVQGDLDGDDEVRRLVEGCDAVIHCAVGKVWGDRRRNFEINVGGSKRLAEAALAAGVRRFVHFSTISVYGDDSRLTGTLEEMMPPAPTKGSDYGESKAASEQAVLEVAQRGLNACVFRPARVFGPFSGIFVVNPLTAMAEGRFHWLGDPNVPCDMVYVDNLAHAVLRALESSDESVRGQVFNISDGDASTWREFYDYFAGELGFDLSAAPADDPFAHGNGHARRGLIGGAKSIVTSPEFRALGRRMLDTGPYGTLPRWALNRFPAIERTVRKIVGADGSLPVYRRELPKSDNVVHMGSAGAVASIVKARELLGYSPAVSRPDALELTLTWVRHARIATR